MHFSTPLCSVQPPAQLYDVQQLDHTETSFSEATSHKSPVPLCLQPSCSLTFFQHPPPLLTLIVFISLCYILFIHLQCFGLFFSSPQGSTSGAEAAHTHTSSPLQVEVLRRCCDRDGDSSCTPARCRDSLALPQQTHM